MNTRRTAPQGSAGVQRRQGHSARLQARRHSEGRRNGPDHLRSARGPAESGHRSVAVRSPQPCELQRGVAGARSDPRRGESSGVIADAGGTLVGFPAGGWTLRNQGYGDAVAENGILRHGFYVCETNYIAGYPDNDPLNANEPLCTAIDEFQSTLPRTPYRWIQVLKPSTRPTSASQCSRKAITSLVLVVDDTLEVSEFNEVNNWVAVDDLHRRTQRAAGGHGLHLRHRRRYAAERHRVARQRSGRR